MDNNTLHQNTEERILQAAEQIFYRDGIQGARMQDIADLANINRAMLHYYYRDKKSMARKVIEKAVLNFHSSTHKFLDSDASFEEKMDSYVKHQIELYSSNPELIIFAIHESLRDKDMLKRIFQDKHSHVNKTFSNQLNEEVRKGNIRTFTMEEFVIFVNSQCAFPFIAGPIFKMIFNWNDEKWEAYRTQLIQSLPETIKRSVYINNQI
jgi:AcrR family transcriptional regulator